MRPSELLDPGDVLLDFQPTDKWQAIDDLVHHLVATGKLPAALEARLVHAINGDDALSLPGLNFTPAQLEQVGCGWVGG